MDPASKGNLALIVRELEKMNEHLAVQNRLAAIALRRVMYQNEKAIPWVESIVEEVV